MSLFRRQVIQEIRGELRAGADDGISCPCCSRLVKRYRRKLNSGMAATLVWLVRYLENHPEEDWVYVNKKAPRLVLRRGGEWTLMSHWDLIETKPPEDESRTSGLWRPTPHGVSFAHNDSASPSHAVIVCGELECLDGDLIGIITALGEHFDYDELWRGGGYGQ